MREHIRDQRSQLFCNILFCSDDRFHGLLPPIPSSRPHSERDRAVKHKGRRAGHIQQVLRPIPRDVKLAAAQEHIRLVTALTQPRRYRQCSLYAETCEELQLKEMEARRQVEEAVFRRKHPTVAEYCEKWLLMQSAKVSSGTLRGYTQTMNNYIVKPLGDMYLEDVTADDIRLAMIPLASKSAGLYSKVNMLLKCVFYSAERSQLLEYNPCEGLSAKGYQCRIFILLFIGNQNSNYIPVFQAGKSGNVSSAPFNAADFPLIFKNRQRSPDRLSADTVSDSQLLFGGKLVDSLLNRI